MKKKTINSIQILIRPLLNFEKKNLEFISNHVFNFLLKTLQIKMTIFQRIKIRNLISAFNKNGLDKNKLSLTLKNLKNLTRLYCFMSKETKNLKHFFNKKNK